MNRKQFLWGVMLLLAVQTARAQYPQVPPEEQAVADAMEAAAKAKSDSAWQVAYPIVLQEALEGRPYITFAQRPYDLPQAKIPSFPGAEGGGMYSFGGRGGKVLTVTNLNDDGPGSLRWACEQGGARIIVFNVSGTIVLKSPLIIRAPYITIAGQTAPGQGVQISGESIWVDTHDVVVRHMRFRRAVKDVARRDDTFGGNPIGNIMLDHLSCSFGGDENLSFYRHKYRRDESQPWLKYPTVNVTIQNTISAKALDTWNHAFGSTLGGENCAFLRNLWSCNTGRNPSIGWNGIFNMVNNVVYNWVHRTADGGDSTALYNIYKNYYKPGPATPTSGPVAHRIVKPESGHSKSARAHYGRVYCADNVVEGFPVVTADNWKGGVQIEGLSDAGDYEREIRWNEPHPHPYYTEMTATEAYEYVLNNVGAMLPCRDILDTRIVDEVRTNKPYYAPNATPDTEAERVGYKHRRLSSDSYKLGIVTDAQQMGGIPVYNTNYKKWVDSDGDGMPDVWEKKHGLNPHDPSDANGDMTGDGYTNIEKYINAIPTDKKIDWTDVKNNYDTLAGKKSLY